MRARERHRSEYSGRWSCHVQRLQVTRQHTEDLFHEHRRKHGWHQNTIAHNGQPLKQSQNELTRSPLSNEGHDVLTASDVYDESSNGMRAAVWREQVN